MLNEKIKAGRGASEQDYAQLTSREGGGSKRNMSTSRIPMLSVGAFEPGASASPYQTLLRRSLLATRSTFAVRSRVYLHHKCFETQLVRDLDHTGLDRLGGGGVWGGRQSQTGHIHCSRACRVGSCGWLSQSLEWLRCALRPGLHTIRRGLTSSCNQLASQRTHTVDHDVAQ